MSSTRHHSKLGSAPPMTRVEWAIARYNWYRACGLLDDLPQQTIETPSHGRSPHQPSPKPHLKWYPLSKSDDDVATTYQQPVAVTRRHRYSQQANNAHPQTFPTRGHTGKALNHDTSTWSRVEWAIARYNWYRACGLLDDIAPPTAETTRYQRSPDPAPSPKPHLKWYPLNKPDYDVAMACHQPFAANQRRYNSPQAEVPRPMIARYQADQEEIARGFGLGSNFDPSKHPRAERGRRNGGQFIKSGEGGERTVEKTSRRPFAKPGQTSTLDGHLGSMSLENRTQENGSITSAAAHTESSVIQPQQGQIFYSIPPEKLARKLPPEAIPDLLEEFPLLPDETLEQLLSNLGYSLDGPKGYQSAWRAIVMRKIGITPNQLAGYTDFQLHNQQVMKAIYSYYQALYNENPALLWAGMAKVAGNAVWDGLQLNLFARNSPSAQVDRLSVYFERELIQMNREIFEDLGWVHEAYRTGGMREINSLYKMDAVSEDVRDAFAKIDDGIRTKNNTMIEEGNEKLLRREQETVLKRGYRELTKRNLDKVMGSLGDNPIPGGRHFSETVNGGSLTKFEDRWKWIEREMIWRWNTMTPAERAKYVNGPLGSSDTIAQQLLRRLRPSDAVGRNPDLGRILSDFTSQTPDRMTPEKLEMLREALKRHQ